ncbi:hypothetical protein GCM10009613_54470 [Pseudonocardia kongjuensis]|uniref:Uncharacterized protein n=1 Tax=Pseudonocardia kongjuensis TaxID=102227 RepID=A0ABN1Y6C2_9PSEU
MSQEYILGQLETWLRTQKKIDLNTRSNISFQQENRKLVVVHNTNRSGSSVRCRLVESGENTWRTDLTFFTPARPGTGWVDVTIASDLRSTPKPPKFFDRIADVINAPRDGQLPLLSTPPLISLSRSDEVINWIADSSRHALLFVAGTNDQLDLMAWQKKVQLWSRDFRGLAQAVILDPATTEIVNDKLAHSHQIHPWTIRTFLPGVRLDEPADGSRHKILGWQRLGEDTDPAIRALLASIARRHASRRPRPIEVVRATRDLDRVTSALLLEQIFGTSDNQDHEPDPETTADDSTTADVVETRLTTSDRASGAINKEEIEQLRDLASEQKSLLASVAGVLGLKSTWSIEDLQQVASQLQNERQARLKSERNLVIMQRSRTELQKSLTEADDLREKIELLQLELSEEEQERQLADLLRIHAEEESLWLRRKFRELREWDLASARLPADAEPVIPDSFDELVDRIGEFESSRIFFTGSATTTRKLCDLDGSGKIARATWECLLVLQSYLAARESGNHDGNVHHYLESTPTGYRGYSPKKHAYSESESTLAKFGSLRMLPVPSECRDEGFVVMEAHFKLGKVGIRSPRMHYFDDYSGNRAIYIGYIGPHLRTVTTN